MTNEEKLVIDTLVSMSKSLSKISDELSAIKNMLLMDQKQKLRESKNTSVKSSILNENNGIKKLKIVRPVHHEKFSDENALKEIREIRNGGFLK